MSLQLIATCANTCDNFSIVTTFRSAQMPPLAILSGQ